METLTINNTTYNVENKYDYYPLLLDEPCQGCAAYENLGHCGTWGPGCWIMKAKCQIDSLKANTALVDEEEILSWLLWKDCVEFQTIAEVELFDPFEEDYYSALNYDPFEEVRYLYDKELYL